MPATDSVQVINHHQANLNIKERTTTSTRTTGGDVHGPGGIVIHRPTTTTTTTRTSYKTNITVEVHSEPIAVCLDEAAVARHIAVMYAQRVREQTKAIAKTVEPATAAKRRSLEKAFAQGKSYAVKQFSGGRTGVTPPVAGSNQAFNHSGRLADGIVAMLRGKDKDAEWVINYPANRWDLKHWGDASKMQAAFQKWVALVPILQDASSDVGIVKAAKDMMADVLHKQKMDAGHRASKLAGEQIVKVLQFVARAA